MDSWQPTAEIETLRLRARSLERVRRFFADRQVLEVETPVLCSAAVTDPHIASISCQLNSLLDRKLYLRTSPEFHMKRLLAAGMPDIYQIGKAFRDDEIGARHQPEFTLIEWYRLGFELSEIIDETCALIMAISSACPTPISGVECIPYRELLLAKTGCDPLDEDPERFLQSARTALADQLEPQLEQTLGQHRSTWLDLLMSQLVAPGLGRSGISVVFDFPAEQAQLARLSPQDPRTAERFEIFHRGVELANGYRELTDPVQQRLRFDSDRQRRSELGLPDVEPDQALLQALERGLPDCSGVAMGLDRILMLCNNYGHIADTISFSVDASPH